MWKKTKNMEQVPEIGYNSKLTERLENLIKSRDKLKLSSLSPSDSNYSDTTTGNKLSQNIPKVSVSIRSNSSIAKKGLCIGNRCMDNGVNSEHGFESEEQTSNTDEIVKSKNSYYDGIMDKQQQVDEDIAAVYQKHHQDRDLQVSHIL